MTRQSRIEPDKTLASDPVQWKKKSKDRATILITCNSTGDNKLPIRFIYKYQNPRPLRHIDKEEFSKCQSLISIYENLIVKCNILLMDNAFPHTLKVRTLEYIIFLQISTTHYSLAMQV